VRIYECSVCASMIRLASGCSTNRIRNSPAVHHTFHASPLHEVDTPRQLLSLSSHQLARTVHAEPTSNNANAKGLTEGRGTTEMPPVGSVSRQIDMQGSASPYGLDPSAKRCPADCRADHMKLRFSHPLVLIITNSILRRHILRPFSFAYSAPHLFNM